MSEFKLNDLESLLALYMGTPGYKAGVEGTVTLTGSKKVVGIIAHSDLGGTVSINDGDDIIIPAGTGFSFSPKGNYIDPEIIFTDTDSYVVEYITI
jgi:hypothetical protein